MKDPKEEAIILIANQLQNECSDFRVMICKANNSIDIDVATHTWYLKKFAEIITENATLKDKVDLLQNAIKHHTP